jgi:hypothetical protein
MEVNDIYVTKRHTKVTPHGTKIALQKDSEPRPWAGPKVARASAAASGQLQTAPAAPTKFTRSEDVKRYVRVPSPASDTARQTVNGQKKRPAIGYHASTADMTNGIERKLSKMPPRATSVSVMMSLSPPGVESLVSPVSVRDSQPIYGANELTTDEPSSKTLPNDAAEKRLLMSPPILVDGSRLTNPTAPLQELRAQRKIKDLEISNLSMQGVNKYLERRLHHQQKEIALLKELCTRNEIMGSLLELSDSEADSSDSESDDETQHISIADGDENTQWKVEALTRERECIERLNRAQESTAMLRRCLQISNILLDDAKRSLDMTIMPTDVKVGGKVAESANDEVDDVYDAMTI